LDSKTWLPYDCPAEPQTPLGIDCASCPTALQCLEICLPDTGISAFQAVVWCGFLAGAKWTSVPVCAITDIGFPDMCVSLSALPPERLFAGIDDVAGLDPSVTPWQLTGSNAILRIPGTVVFRGRV
jgi:hypothetical protein